MQKTLNVKPNISINLDPLKRVGYFNRLPFFVYFLGMFPRGYWQDSVRALLGNWLAFVAVIGYLLTLRLIGRALVQLVDFRRKKLIIEHNRLGEERKKK